MSGAHRDSSFVGGLLQYFDQHEVWTQWYWPGDVHGKMWNAFHGNGWQAG